VHPNTIHGRWYIVKQTWLVVSSLSCVALACVLGSVGGWLLYVPPPTQSRPTVTDWMQGLGTIVGVLASVAAVLIGVLVLRNERDDLRRAEQETVLRVPRAVMHTSVAPGWAGTRRLRDIAVRVDNYGPEPIRRLVIVLRSEPDDMDIIMPLVNFLPPGDHVRPEVVYEPHGVEVLSPMEQNNLVVTLRFLDLAGREWERVNNGEPTRPTSPLPAITALL
jgi:hypothetical protein